MFAEQLAMVPPLTPLQLQDHGPLPDTLEVFPALQRFVVGAVGNVPPLEEPQTPLIILVAEQFAVVPPLNPAQDQVYVVGFVVTEELSPTEQRLANGADE